ncbi:MAG: alpha/beta fold hydrolase [Gammaproteobacteria bacterium]|nr:alpha/beta fold hydrolase [Gammaproteobacteria bacterium]
MSSLPKLAYTIHSGNGPYLALLHGFLSSSTQWQHNLETLGEVCQPVTIDLFGHGASPAPNNPKWYQPSTYIKCLDEIRQQLDTQKWFLCGYSLSAGLTIRYTYTYPQHVAGHIFTNSASALGKPEQVQSWQRDAAFNADKVAKGGMRAINRIPVHPRFAKRLPKDIYDALVMDATRVSIPGIAHTMRETTPHTNVRDIANNNPCPALLCFGEHEKRFEENMSWARANMTQLEIALLNAGHAVNMEDAQGFNATVSEFITRILSQE